MAERRAHMEPGRACGLDGCDSCARGALWRLLVMAAALAGLSAMRGEWGWGIIAAVLVALAGFIWFRQRRQIASR